jgi:hypothetical protein
MDEFDAIDDHFASHARLLDGRPGRPVRRIAQLFVLSAGAR